tara:strand:- start:862 stop:1581 length:720 start_codon:yes stop_codon:yes gene_type:complete
MNVGEITMWFDIIKSDKRDYDKEFKDAVIKKIHNETKINRFLNAYNNSKVKDIYIEPNDRHPLSAIQKQRILESNFSTPQVNIVLTVNLHFRLRGRRISRGVDIILQDIRIFLDNAIITVIQDSDPNLDTYAGGIYDTYRMGHSAPPVFAREGMEGNNGLILLNEWVDLPGDNYKLVILDNTKISRLNGFTNLTTYNIQQGDVIDNVSPSIEKPSLLFIKPTAKALANVYNKATSITDL